MKSRDTFPRIVLFYLAYCYFQFGLVLVLSFFDPERVNLDASNPIGALTLLLTGVSIVQHHLRARSTYYLAAVLVVWAFVWKVYRYAMLLSDLITDGASVSQIVGVFSIRIPALIIVSVFAAAILHYRRRPLAWVGENHSSEEKIQIR